MEDFEPMTYDEWKTTDPGAEFLGDAEQEESEDSHGASLASRSDDEPVS
jgi:hypothetical protein